MRYGISWGYEYRSKAEFLGLPLVHVAQGIDPETGRPRVARGIIAVGNLASYQGTFLYQPDSTGVHIVEVVPWSGTLQGPPASVAIIVR